MSRKRISDAERELRILAPGPGWKPYHRKVGHWRKYWPRYGLRADIQVEWKEHLLSWKVFGKLQWPMGNKYTRCLYHQLGQFSQLLEPEAPLGKTILSKMTHFNSTIREFVPILSSLKESKSSGVSFSDICKIFPDDE